MTTNISTILITGAPGVGKTTLVRRICEQLQNLSTIECKGFYTKEVRQQGSRIGFDVISLNGDRDILARESTNDLQHRSKIGKYSVYTEEFEKIALPLLVTEQTASKQIIVIDEVGKMELLSNNFEVAVMNLIGKTKILATIPLLTPRALPALDRLRTARNSILFTITKANRNQMEQEILSCIKEIMG